MEPIQTEIVVIGAGPGGYTAAFYAADHGRKVILVEREPRLGGVCLNCGCIPSKALLNAAHTINLAREAQHWGLNFEPPRVDLDRLRAWKESILQKLGGGVAQLAQRRNVQVLTGRGYFEDSETLRVETGAGQQFIKFQHAIVATGSKPAMPRAFDLGNPRIMTSTEALEIRDIPPTLLVVGGGYIGMELGTVYATLGTQVVVVEAAPQILTGADPDLARPIAARAAQQLGAAVGQHLVHVHVGLGAGTGLPYGQREFVGMPPLQYLVGGADDGVRLVPIQQAERAVDRRRGPLHLGQRRHQFRRHALARDGEVVERALGLRPPKAGGRHVDRAEAVLLCPVFHTSVLICNAGAKECSASSVNYA